MKASELRISSYFMVNWFKEIRKADWMDIRDIAENKIEGGVSPIPLSPEILEKAGFVFAYKTYQYKDFMFLKNGHLAYKLSVISQDVKYLHHLQNLVFDLTGQELTINLK